MMDTTINNITYEMTGKTIKIYSVHNPLEEILEKTYKTQTEAFEAYVALIEDDVQDTTGDMFQAAGERAPFSMISKDADMVDSIDYTEDKDNKNQLNLFTEDE